MIPFIVETAIISLNVGVLKNNVTIDLRFDLDFTVEKSWMWSDKFSTKK